MTASATTLGRPLNVPGSSGGGSYQPYFTAGGGVEGPSLLQTREDSFSRKYHGAADPTTSGLLGGGPSQPYRYDCINGGASHVARLLRLGQQVRSDAWQALRRARRPAL
jgi:hypothetical protein